MKQLPHTWDALLARFNRFTEIQQLALPPLLAGRNCMLVAATASGKTEAALAPLLERYKQACAHPAPAHRPARGSIHLIYVAPTRALTRDLARRLTEPLARLAVRMAIKTGDEPALNAARPPALLLTTPESLDSLLANRPRLTRDVRAVVLDELHLYDNTARGDGLRILLNRLRRIKKYAHTRGEAASADLQCCALSATLDEPSVVAARYFANPVLLQVGGSREIDAELLPFDGTDSLRRLWATFGHSGRRKALVFCRSRAECEVYAHLSRDAAPFGAQVFAHHAHLSAQLRHHVEKSFTTAGAALCFATSTLELGIDIGDVDLIVLVGPPDNTSSLLQRIGRGNRRTRRTAVACFYRTEAELALFRVLLRAAASGSIGSEPYFFRPSVVMQQLCSYVKQTRFGEIEPRAAYELFASPQGEPLLPRALYDQIVAHLVEQDYFVPVRQQALRPGPKWQELYERRAIYSNLVDTTRELLPVCDELTGRPLGAIESNARRGTTFLLGGQAREVVRRRDGRLIARVAAPDAAVKTPRRRTRWRPMPPALVRALAVELGVPGADSASSLMMLVESPDDDDVDAGAAATVSTRLCHYGGAAYGIVLGAILARRHQLRIGECNEFWVELSGLLPAGALHLTTGEVQAQVQRHWQQLEGAFEMGGFHRQLPPRVRREAIVNAFDRAKFLRLFAACELIIAPGGDT